MQSSIEKVLFLSVYYTLDDCIQNTPTTGMYMLQLNDDQLNQLKEDIFLFSDMERCHSITFRNESLLEQLKSARDEFRKKTYHKRSVSNFYKALKQRWEQVNVSLLVLEFMLR